jgi:hypothetical protein
MLIQIDATKVSLTRHVAILAIAACVAGMAFCITVAFTGEDWSRTESDAGEQGHQKQITHPSTPKTWSALFPELRFLKIVGLAQLKQLQAISISPSKFLFVQLQCREVTQSIHLYLKVIAAGDLAQPFIRETAQLNGCNRECECISSQIDQGP